MPSLNLMTKKMAILKKKNKRKFEIQSKFWVWPFWAGAFFALGYSITKNIFLPNIFPKQKIQTNLDILRMNKKSLDQKNSLIKGIDRQLNFQNKSQTSQRTISKKTIYIPTSEDSDLRLTINYSEKQNLEKQEIFENNHSFFQKENIDSLLETLINTKKLNLLK